ncbi:hypothetical protein JNB_01500 [Janibacter sp. HTCC2649]|uniref:hypothetical protein n=1 Tax=Janibacter sp. HTCC2649 TaxID=313589 RepID=UPI000066EC1A|nr:hypothetical protein [Janibacter sp. HTCC2649]EAP98802.1 hypothetical protein JNB_01500 [Janibacter sp. HTCC2649]
MTLFTTRRTFLGGAVAGVALGAAPAAQAAYYNTYSDIASTPTAYECTGAQAFAAGSTYLYSVKNRTTDDGRAIIYRVNRTTGAKEIMTNTAGTDSKYISGLGHANDMSIVDINAVHHFFVVTMSTTGAQLVKLRYSGSTYYQVGSYSVHLGGVAKAVSGISRMSISSSAITFFFKSGATVYKGSLPLTANSGTINITKAFDLKTSGALVNGVATDFTGFAHQGFYYHEAADTVYCPLTKENVSIVLVYRNITSATTGTVTSDPNLSFRITSGVYADKFEIEGVGISGGNLYFNTNRAKTAADAGWDGVHLFKGYTAT